MGKDEADKSKEAPKIVTDEDWKAEAEAEKAKLAEQETSGRAAGAGAGTGAAGGRSRELPAASFTTLVSSLVMQVRFALGGLQDPKSGQRYLDLPLAKHHIDTLGVLEEKTRGNLTEEEKKLLDNALYEVRMAYVQVAQGVG